LETSSLNQEYKANDLSITWDGLDLLTREGNHRGAILSQRNSYIRIPKKITKNDNACKAIQKKKKRKKKHQKKKPTPTKTNTKKRKRPHQAYKKRRISEPDQLGSEKKKKVKKEKSTPQNT